MMGSIALNFAWGILVSPASDKLKSVKQKKFLLAAAIATNLALLGVL